MIAALLPLLLCQLAGEAVSRARGFAVGVAALGIGTARADAMCIRWRGPLQALAWGSTQS